MKRFIAAIAASFLLHALSLWCLNLIPATVFMPEDAVDHFVEFVEPEDAKPIQDREKEKLIVRKHSVPAEMLRPDDPEVKRFSSDKRQTVLEETRASESGLTQNRADTFVNRDQLGAIIPEKFGLAKKRGTHTFTSDDGADSDIAVSSREGDGRNQQRSLPLPSLTRFGLEAGRSTFGNSAPNVRIGEMTALNTDQLLYYSYYERMQEMIYNPWVKYVKAVLYSYAQKNASTGDEVWLTHLEIILDKQGNFVKALVHQGSGLQGLDLAAVHAFKEAKQIPHPPQEMVQDDGTIRIQYAFEVYASPRYARSN